MEKAVKFYCKTFDSTTEGKSLLEKFGITDAGIYGKRMTGYADGSLLKALPPKGEILEDLKAVGILSKGKEYFHHRVTLPVLDSDNRIVNIAGIGSDGDCIYLPKLTTGTFNEGITKTYPEVFLANSILDLLSLEMAGINNVICTTDKSFKGAKVSLPDNNQSANAFLLKYGAEDLKNYIECQKTSQDTISDEQSLPPGAFVIQRGLRKYTLIGLEKRGRNLKCTIKADKGGKIHFDTINLYSAKDRRFLAQDLTLAFDELPETVQSDIEYLVKNCESRSANPTSDMVGSRNQPSVMTSGERDQCIDFGKSANLTNLILEDYNSCGLVGEEINKLVCYLAMTSRKLKKPLNVMILSSSGAGKSALQDATLAFCPPEDLVKITSLSGKALFYKQSGSLRHKVLALEEQTGAENAAYAIRTLISSDVLISETTVRDNATGKLTSMENRVDAGKTSVFCTTTNPDIDAETRSRFIVTGISESKEQTRAILQAQRQSHTLKGLETDYAKEKIIARQRNFQRLLKPYMVVNPYAEDLKFDCDNLTARRIQPILLQLINAIAFLRQMRKEVKTYEKDHGKEPGIEYIEADVEDIALAEKIASQVLNPSDDLSIPGKDLLDQIGLLTEHKLSDLKKQTDSTSLRKEDITFTRRELCEFAGWRRTRLHNHLKELIEAEYVILDSGRTRSLQYYKLAAVHLCSPADFNHKTLKISE